MALGTQESSFDFTYFSFDLDNFSFDIIIFSFDFSHFSFECAFFSSDLSFFLWISFSLDLAHRMSTLPRPLTATHSLGKVFEKFDFT